MQVRSIPPQPGLLVVATGAVFALREGDMTDISKDKVPSHYNPLGKDT